MGFSKNPSVTMTLDKSMQSRLSELEGALL